MMMHELASKTRTIKLTVEYDGSDFAGWQVQPEQRTVQGVIESSLESFIHRSIRIVGAGRTDAGVHALGQAVSFRSDSTIPTDAFKEGLNHFLPGDVRVLDAEEKSNGFHARRDAVYRTYKYRLTKKSRVIERQYAWYPGPGIRLEPMKNAAKRLFGEHDFTSFCKAQPQNNDPVSRVDDIQWVESDDEISFSITANRFFHHMVRIILGSLLEVGRGRRSEDSIMTILKARDRRQAGPTIPPQGLYLVNVVYDRQR